jgi:YidC/Oxa1 family membrane protein insertase
MDRNVILALVLTALIFFGYDALIVAPKREAYQEAQKLAAEEQMNRTPIDPSDTGEIIVPGSNEAVDRETALARAPARLPVSSDAVEGSINLRGLVLDDLILKNFRATVEEDSPPIVLLSPAGSDDAQYLSAGLLIDGQRDSDVVWSAPEGARLTPASPVTLTRSENGLEHRVTLGLDEKFMFSVRHEVVNESGVVVTVEPYGAVFQRGIPDDLQNFMILFEGPLGVVDGKLYDRKFKKLLNNGAVTEAGIGGWTGITDKYWLAAAIPPQDEPFQLKLDARQGAVPLFGSTYQLERRTLQPNETLDVTSHLYAGAKVVEILRSYEAPIGEGGLGVVEFDKAVDWGNFFFLTRPIFGILHFFHGIFGNYGVAILMLTLVIKAILFPLANTSYKSMAGMRKVQPEVTRLRERYKDDQMKMQQEMMALYKKHKINPAAGCLPILAQMPIFYALYKTLFVTIEMRHEGFLYIRDLSEQDPTSIFNLFGLLPYDPTQVPVIGTFLGLGILPLIMGAAMFVQMKLNPPPPDPMQRRIFALMPLFFMFLFAPFAAGLVLYWTWNTILSVIQQYIIMKRQGADVDLLGNLRQTFGSKPAAANENKAK